MEQINERTRKSSFTFCEDGDKPEIRVYSKNPKYRPNDQVYIRLPGAKTREGPYTVSSVKDGRYTLCDAKGNRVKDGAAIEEQHLELDDPFQ